MRRRTVLSALVALAALPALACSKEKAATPGATKVTLALNWVSEPEFGGFYAARANGSYAKAGLDVDILGGGPGSPVVQMVAAGKVDFGIVSADEILIARGRGADVVPVFAVYQTSPAAIMAHASRHATRLADVLASGTLAMDPGAPAVTFFKKKFGSIGARMVPSDGGVARFLADKDYAQQCYATSEPLAAKKSGGDPQVFLLADEGFGAYATVVATRKALLQEKPAIVRAFVQATRDGWRAYLDDPAPANAIMAKLNTTMSLETFAEVAAAQRPLIESAETREKGLGAMRRDRWDALGKQLVEIGIIPSAPAVDDYLVPIP